MELERPVYAIGDVHGRADLLRPLLAAIEEGATGQVPRVIFLGDIIDRGPDSKEALELVDDALDRFPGSQLILGNHDEYFLLALEGLLTDTDAFEWLEGNGGHATIQSYAPGSRPTVGQFAAFIREYYTHHHSLLKSAVDKVLIGSHCFVHAGIRPGVPLDVQNSSDLRWIRDEFLNHPGQFEKIIVHGHTPTETDLPEIYPNRIAVDTGAYATGRLTAAVFKKDIAPRFICTTERSAGTVDVEHLSAEQAIPLLPTV
ncbi:serine/threonine protein phosphatase [Agrobacterium rhizogenes]|nr:serine/threonine protein phosphatase [Rhizobium rhizogenes]NTH38205.1 serine/threonine protein phosphatase [Rhizobium rhizogenes]NTJ05394.1 serine/threonine protein phosphatase [Rhizobium rhizogenes]